MTDLGLTNSERSQYFFRALGIIAVSPQKNNSKAEIQI